MDYEYRTYDSMIVSSEPTTRLRWAVLVDWDEAMHYAQTVATIHGLKMRVTQVEDGWFAHATGQQIPRPESTGVAPVLSRTTSQHKKYK